MWARCLPDPPAAALGALLRRDSRSFVTALVLVLVATAAGAVAPAHARHGRLESGRASLDVVSDEGDTIPVTRDVREVTITREGIRIQSGDKVVVQSGRHSRRRGVDIEILGGDSARHIVIDDRRRSGEIVNFFQDIDVPVGRTVNGDVVALFGNVHVHGTVESDVVAILGSVDLTDSARVGGEVVAIGGTVRAAPTAEIHGESFALPVCGRPCLAPWLPMAAGIASLVLFLVLGALVSLLFPERLGRVAATVSRRTFLSLVVGVLSLPLLPLLGLLLCITVIGIPVAILLLFLYPVAAFVGYVASCALIGARFRGRAVTEPPIWPSALLGLAFVGLFFVGAGVCTSIPGDAGVLRVVGFVLLGVGLVIGLVSTLLGLGALFLSRLGEPERAPRPRMDAGSAPPTTPGAGGSPDYPGTAS